jgi:hypothetical protein
LAQLAASALGTVFKKNKMKKYFSFSASSDLIWNTPPCCHPDNCAAILFQN